MFRLRVIRIVAGLTAGLLLTACSGTSSNFDPTDWITGEFFSTKTPLPGDRKPVFPGGVPGVPEGVPPELVKGNQQPVVEAAAAPEPAPAAKPAQPARPQATRPAPKPRTASAPPQPTPVRAAPQPTPVRAAPAAQPARPAPANQPGVAWPDPNKAPAPRPAQSTPPTANWPDPNSQANWPPPDPNTFSR